jgi:hypothetical protein
VPRRCGDPALEDDLATLQPGARRDRPPAQPDGARAQGAELRLVAQDAPAALARERDAQADRAVGADRRAADDDAALDDVHGRAGERPLGEPRQQHPAAGPADVEQRQLSGRAVAEVDARAREGRRRRRRVRAHADRDATLRRALGVGGAEAERVGAAEVRLRRVRQLRAGAGEGAVARRVEQRERQRVAIGVAAGQRDRQRRALDEGQRLVVGRRRAVRGQPAREAKDVVVVVAVAAVEQVLEADVVLALAGVQDAGVRDAVGVAVARTELEGRAAGAGDRDAEDELLVLRARGQRHDAADLPVRGDRRERAVGAVEAQLARQAGGRRADLDGDLPPGRVQPVAETWQRRRRGRCGRGAGKRADGDRGPRREARVPMTHVPLP